MNIRRSFYLIGCTAIVLAIAYGNGSVVQGEPQELAAQNSHAVDFTDKIVVLDITGGHGLNSESEVLILANARVLKIGNRDFIVGDSLPLRDDEDDFYKDVSVGTPCDDIATFRSMTRDRFKSYAEKWREQDKD